MPLAFMPRCLVIILFCHLLFSAQTGNIRQHMVENCPIGAVIIIQIADILPAAAAIAYIGIAAGFTWFLCAAGFFDKCLCGFGSEKLFK